jgi:hypothetical protein
MTDSDDKSMDDVLASIRRIVRAEKESSVVTASGEGPHEDIDRRSEDEEPLVLTPEMRTDAGAEHAPARPELAADTAEASGGSEPLDRDVLRAMLRDLLREELSGGPAEEAVRGIIREELMSGQVGRNISQNVLRLIREEVAKAMQTPR